MSAERLCSAAWPGNPGEEVRMGPTQYRKKVEEIGLGNWGHK